MVACVRTRLEVTAVRVDQASLERTARQVQQPSYYACMSQLFVVVVVVVVVIIVVVLLFFIRFCTNVCNALFLVFFLLLLY